jgi:hypothetical protein
MAHATNQSQTTIRSVLSTKVLMQHSKKQAPAARWQSYAHRRLCTLQLSCSCRLPPAGTGSQLLQLTATSVQSRANVQRVAMSTCGPCRTLHTGQLLCCNFFQVRRAVTRGELPRIMLPTHSHMVRPIPNKPS